MSSSPEAEALASMSAGQMLRQARLKAGVHLAVLSVHLKVPVKQLEALEADDLDPTKGPVFYRGLTASVCRQLGVDAAPILKLLPRLSGQLEPVKRLELPSGSASASFKRDSANRQHLPAGWIALAAALLALSLFFIWMPAATSWAEQHLASLSWFSRAANETVTQEIEVQPPVTSLPGPAASQEGPAPAPQPPTPPAAEAARPAVQMPAPPAAPAAPNPGSNASASGRQATWVFTATGESWLELRDATNSVVWRGVLKAGDTQRLESPVPVRVVVGRAQVVTATLRGQAFDLQPHTQANVARFEVKE